MEEKRATLIFGKTFGGAGGRSFLGICFGKLLGKLFSKPEAENQGQGIFHGLGGTNVERRCVVHFEKSYMHFAVPKLGFRNFLKFSGKSSNDNIGFANDEDDDPPPRPPLTMPPRPNLHPQQRHALPDCELSSKSFVCMLQI